MKSLKITQQTAQALSEGATMLLMPIPQENQIECIRNGAFDIFDFLPIQAGDEFYCTDEDGCRIIGMRLFDCVDVEVKRVQDLKELAMRDLSLITLVDVSYWHKILRDDFIEWLNEQHGSNFYESNPYVALIKTGESNG
jgi:hypothetical protein